MVPEKGIVKSPSSKLELEEPPDLARRIQEWRKQPRFFGLADHMGECQSRGCRSFTFKHQFCCSSESLHGLRNPHIQASSSVLGLSYCPTPGLTGDWLSIYSDPPTS